MKNLEDKLIETYRELRIPEEPQMVINTLLRIIKSTLCLDANSDEDSSSYRHCIRVGILGKKIAQHMHLDAKAMFYAGVLHDVGKAGREDTACVKTIKGPDGKSSVDVKVHAIISYNMIKDLSKFSAKVALWHHYFSEHGYPRELTKPNTQYARETIPMISFYARLLSLADSYDMIAESKPKGSKRIILGKNKDQRCLIEELYKAGIFRQQAAQ
ncbi:MAG: HD domain-containing protein [Candidatus Nanoarchaeia archaeon]|jgi:putative nucleotidyltransferase with HDIG domain